MTVSHSLDFYLTRGMVIFISAVFGVGLVSGFLSLIGQSHLGWWLMEADLVLVISVAAVTWGGVHGQRAGRIVEVSGLMAYTGNTPPKCPPLRVASWVIKDANWVKNGWPTKLQAPEISVMVRHDEAAWIEEKGRCTDCGHLEVFHMRFLGGVYCSVPDDTCPCRVR